MISPNSTKIETLLSTSLRFVVPKYQREYAWKESHAGEFFEDVLDYSQPEAGNLFLGTVIFDISEEKKNNLIIVDGQQRITTILLLLIACRQLAKNLALHELVMLIQQEIAYVDNSTGKSLGFRLDSSKSIKEVLNFISEKDWNGDFPAKIDKKRVKLQVAKLKPIYSYFMEQISEFSQEQLSRFLNAIYQAYVVKIDIPNRLEAFSIFERTNARGVELEVSDLLKNYLFKAEVTNLEERWDQIVRNSDNTLLRMLKYFYVSKNGYVSKSQLYKKIKSYSDGLTPEELVRKLEAFSDYYSVVRNADAEGIHTFFLSIECPGMGEKEYRAVPVYRALEGLRLFNVTQIYPLLYAALGCYISEAANNPALGEGLSQKLIRLFEVLEHYHFINNAICQRIGNEVEKLYAEYCVKYSTSKQFAKTTEEFVKELKDRRASPAEFASSFVELSYAPENIPVIVYIFDRINNFGLKPGQTVSMYNPDKTYLRKNHNIEHFYPQTPDKSMKPDPEALKVVDNIGNLLVLSLFVNSQLGNQSPEQKMSLLENQLSQNIQNMRYVQNFIQEYGEESKNWNKDTIERRAEAIAKEAYIKVWNF